MGTDHGYVRENNYNQNLPRIFPFGNEIPETVGPPIADETHEYLDKSRSSHEDSHAYDFSDEEDVRLDTYDDRYT